MPYLPFVRWRLSLVPGALCTLWRLAVPRRKGIGTGLLYAAAGLSGVTALLRYAIKGRSSQIFGQSVYRGRHGRRSVALTFDDGPSEGTGPLLAYLAEQGIRATFFQCGLNAERLPAMAQAVSAAGHEIGNHTYAHPRLPPRFSRRPNLRMPSGVEREIGGAQEVLTRLHGEAPRLFRAPYGMRWFGVGRAQRRFRLLGVLWTAIGHDWEWPAQRIAAHVLRGIGPGGIVCLHDGRDIQRCVDTSETLSALRVIVPALRRAGYRFETVSELLSPEPAR